MSEVAEKQASMEFGREPLEPWRVSADASGNAVFFYVNARGMGGGVFATPDQARDLARLLISAANEVEA